MEGQRDNLLKKKRDVMAKKRLEDTEEWRQFRLDKNRGRTKKIKKKRSAKVI